MDIRVLLINVDYVTYNVKNLLHINKALDEGCIKIAKYYQFRTEVFKLVTIRLQCFKLHFCIRNALFKFIIHFNLSTYL